MTGPCQTGTWASPASPSPGQEARPSLPSAHSHLLGPARSLPPQSGPAPPPPPAPRPPLPLPPRPQAFDPSQLPPELANPWGKGLVLVGDLDLARAWAFGWGPGAGRGQQPLLGVDDGAKLVR